MDVRKVLFTLVIMVLVGVPACAARVVRGSGQVVEEARQVSGFDGIAISGSGEVIVTQGGSESLVIETDDNIMPHVKAEVISGTLELGFEDGFNIINPTRLIFYVGVDDLTEVDISGSGRIEAESLASERFAVKISGSGDVQISQLTADRLIVKISGSGEARLDGEVPSQEVAISGSGKYLAGDLCSPRVSVTVSGSGRATVCATESLDSTVSGSGAVDYFGSPSTNTTLSGSGSINSLGEK